MYKIFVDTDVILDLLMKREPFYKAAVELFRQIELKRIKGYTSPLVIANLHYLLSKIYNKKKSIELLTELLKILVITIIDGETIKLVFEEKKIKDLEDLIQYYSALERDIDFIVTRNIKDFPKTDEIIIIKPDELVKIMESDKDRP
ncbi:MAG: PIN domain-containing protein [Spirochaetia bacterium]|jgi:predicted nucleic acid-binding protein|nr:PIN domain-containing protein [Spirochaetia bacterium]